MTGTLDLCAERLRGLAGIVEAGQLSLTCIPPLQFDPFPYGDLVPLGLLLLALRRAAERGGPQAEACARAQAAVETHLRSHRQGALWAYHRGGQVTSIDSALILLGIDDEAAVLAFEELRDPTHPERGYVPQPWTTQGEPGKMPWHEAVRHWCQPDLTVACLVRFLRRRHGLGETAPLAMLEDGFEHRSGLYIANPYLVDWFYALAIGRDPEGARLRHRLAGEILESVSSSGIFGGVVVGGGVGGGGGDPVVSTAAAVLALAELGVPRSAFAPAVAFLEREIESGTLAAACPFYSTRREDWDKLPVWEMLDAFAADDRKQLIRACDQAHTITFYEDRAGAVVLPLVTLALLAAETGLEGPAPVIPEAEAHGRYRCASPSEYVRVFALPPYLADVEAPGDPDVPNRED